VNGGLWDEEKASVVKYRKWSDAAAVHELLRGISPPGELHFRILENA
jgi:hypothetical protein